MSRKSLILAVAIVLVLAGSAGTALALLVLHEPAFYVRCEVPAGPAREKLSGEFVSELTNQVIQGIYNGSPWEARFTEEQINSYFEEDYLTKHSVGNPLPKGVREPRIAIEAERIRLGFRYGKGDWNSVISMDMRAWLVRNEPNVMALEFQAIHAGGLPISAQSLLEKVYEFARRMNVDAAWYRYNGHPVLLLRFEADSTNLRFQLQQLELRPGMLRLTGRGLM